MNFVLSKGAIAQISQRNSDSGFNPTVQILEAKKIVRGAEERYRIILSDGEHYCHAMLATQLNNLFGSPEDARNCIVEIKESISNVVQNKRIVIVLDMRLLSGPGTAEKIGNPSLYEPTSTPSTGQIKDGEQEPSAGMAPAYHSMQRGGAPPTSAPGYSYNSPRSGMNTGSDSTALLTKSESTQAKRQNIFPIAALNPYQNRWTIKARVTSKSPLRSWNKPNSSGNLFNVDLIDSSGSQIRATLFNTVAESFFELLQVGNVYYVSQGQIKQCNPKFNNLGHEYEVTLDKSSTIEPAEADDAAIPKANNHFTPIKEIEGMPADATVDVIGVVISVGPLSDFTTKAGVSKPKRLITLKEDSCYSIDVTLWGQPAVDFSCQEGTVVSFSRCRISDYGGRSLSVGISSTIDVSPDLKEAHAMQGWFRTGGANAHTTPLSKAFTGGAGAGGSSTACPVRTLSSIKEESASAGDQQIRFSTRATIVPIKHEKEPFYPACPKKGVAEDPQRQCNKRLTQTSTGWRCERCDTTFDRPVYRYLLNFMVTDHSGSLWMTAFNESAEKIMGVDADTLYNYRDGPTYEKVFREAAYKQFHFRGRGKSEVYQDESRLRCSVDSAIPTDYVAHSRTLISQIRSFSG